MRSKPKNRWITAQLGLIGLVVFAVSWFANRTLFEEPGRSPDSAPGFLPALLSGASSPTSHVPLANQIVRLEHKKNAEPEQDVAAFLEFNAWLKSYLATEDGTANPDLLSRGLALASERRAAFRRLIQSNPEEAVRLSISSEARAKLPASMAGLIEEQVSGFGRMEVYCAYSEPGRSPVHEIKTSGLIRYVSVGGRTFKANVYGRRLRQMSVDKLAVHGVAIDGEMALSDNVIRQVPSVPLDGEGNPSTCAHCGRDTRFGNGLSALHGSRLLAFCSSGHLEDLNKALVLAESGPASSLRGLSLAGEVAEPASPNNRIGHKRVLFIPVVFADDRTVPIREDEAVRLMAEVNEFFAESSYKKLSLFTTVTPVVTLPQSKLFYAGRGPGAIDQDARAQAELAGFASANFDLVVLRHGQVPGFTWGGLGGGRTAWLQSSSPGVAAHELGHCFGLGHANFWLTRRKDLPVNPDNYPFDPDSLVGRDSIIGAGVDQAYGDVHDIMGGRGAESAAAAGIVDTNVIASLDGHFNPIGKSTLGWLPRAYVLDASAGATNRIFVHDVSSLTSGRSYAMIVPKDHDRTYWISARSRIRSDKFLDQGVELHWNSWDQALGYSQLLDMTPGSAAGAADSPLLLGRTFSDTAAGIHVTPVARGGVGSERWFDIVVNVGRFDGNRPPQAAIKTSASAVALGEAVTITVPSSDPDGDRMSFFWDFGDGTFGTNNSTVTRTWPTAGDYLVRCEVSDLRGGLTRLQQVIRVGNPTTLRISGRVLDTFGNPLAGARVSSGSLTNFDLGEDYRWTYTDSLGEFTLTGLDPNRYYPVGVHLDGYIIQPLNFQGGIQLRDRDSLDLLFEARPLPRVTVKAIRDATTTPPAPGAFEIRRTGDTNSGFRAVFTVGGSALTNDYRALTNIVSQTNVNPNPFGPVTNVQRFYYVEFAPGVSFTNLFIQPATNSVDWDRRSVSLTMMYALQSRRIADVTNVVTVDFTGWETVLSEGQPAWFQTDPDYIPGSPETATIHIQGKSQTRPIISILAQDPIVTETQDDSSRILLTRSGNLAPAVTVLLRTEGSAVPGSDFDPLPDEVHFDAGQTVLTVPLRVRPNSFLDGNRQVTVRIIPDPSYSTGRAFDVVQILDNDLNRVSISALTSSIQAGATAQGSFLVTRSGDLLRELVVPYLVTGSAVSGADFRTLSGVAVIAPGQPSTIIEVTPRANPQLRGDRILTVVLSDNPAYNVGPSGSADMVIRDATLPVVSIRSDTSNIPEQGGTADFVVSRTGDLSREILVRFNLQGTAVPLADYAGLGDSIRIPAGVRGVTVTLMSIDDQIFEEPADSVTVQIEAGTGYHVGPDSQVRFTISDGDQPVGVGFGTLQSSVVESAGLAEVVVAVTGNPAENLDVTLDYLIVGGTAVAGVDYPVSAASGRLVFQNNTATTEAERFIKRMATIKIPILDNSIAQPDRTVVLALLEPAPSITNEVVTNLVADPRNPDAQVEEVVTNLVVTPIPMNARFDVFKSHTLRIQDDDAAVVTVTASVETAFEEGSQPGEFTLLRTRTNTAQQVYFQLGGGATEGSDYQPVTNPVEFAPGQSSITIPILPVDDPTQEYREEVSLVLLAVPGGRIGTARTATVRIVDNDGTLEFPTTAISFSEELSSARIPVRRTGPATSAVDAEYSFIPGSASPGLDYEPISGRVQFDAGQTEAFISLPILNDTLVENRENLFVRLKNAGDGSALGGQDQIEVWIEDNDTSVKFTEARYQVYENHTNAWIELRREGIASNAFSVGYAVVPSTLPNGSATAGIDFVPTNGVVEFAPGQLTARFAVIIPDDVLFEESEVASLILTNATAGAVVAAPANAILEIIDDECALEFAVSSTGALESQGTVTLDVRRKGGTVNPVTVSFQTRSGTAQAGRDFVSAAGSLSFSGDSTGLRQDGSGVVDFRAGETNRSLAIRLVDNVRGEGERSFEVELSNARGPAVLPPGSVIVGSNGRATVRIIDNDAPGHPDHEFNPGLGPNGTVRSVAVQFDGKALAGGEFTSVDGISLNYVARLHEDGYLDSFLNPGSGPDLPVFAVAAQPDGRILLGGDFTTIGTESRNRVARIKGDGSLDPEFNPGIGANGRVTCIAVQPDGRILVAGLFTRFDGFVRNSLVRLLMDGTVDPAFDSLGTFLGLEIRSLALQKDGRVVVVGGGSGPGTANSGAPFVAGILGDGSPDPSFRPGAAPDGAVRGVVIQPDQSIFVVGDFSRIGGLARNRIARLLPDGSPDPAFDPGEGFAGVALAIGSQPEGRLVVGGAFTAFNRYAVQNLVRLNADGSLDETFDIGEGVDGPVHAIAVQPDSAILIGGDFSHVRGLPRSRIARIHGNDRFTPTMIQFSSDTYSAEEDGGPASILVRRLGSAALAASVEFEASAGSAVAGVNFIPVRGTLHFLPGEQEKTFQVVVLNDISSPGERTVKLSLANPSSGTTPGGRINSTLRILGAEGFAEFAAAQTGVDENSGQALIDVRLSRASPEIVSVDYETFEESARAGTDFQPAAGRLVFLPGTTRQTLAVGIQNDTLTTGNRTFGVQLTGVSGGVGLGGQVRTSVTIREDDGPSFVLSLNTAGGGKISPASGSYPRDQLQELQASADPGFEFVRWEGGINSSINPLKISMRQDFVITAVFRPVQPSLDFSAPFQSATLSRPPWSSGGGSAWLLEDGPGSNAGPSLRSGSVDHGQESTVSLDWLSGQGTGAFDFRLSSEEGWDFLEFSLNGVLIRRWSGDWPWQTFVFPVSAGTNRLSWRYVKDSNFVSGLDAAFVDNLYLPSPAGAGQASRPTLELRKSEPSSIQLLIRAEAGRQVTVETSTNLLTWREVSRLKVNNSGEARMNAPFAEMGAAFFRARVIP